MPQRFTKNDEKFGKLSFAKHVILLSKMRHSALLSASNYPCDLTQITVLFVSDSIVIQYELRSYRVESLPGLT
jgi:hypothetical protein